MTEMLPCPGCHSPLPPEATGCQICMRSRSKHEIMRGYAQLREATARRKRLPFQILATLLIVGVTGKIGWEYRPAMRKCANAVTTRFAAWSDRMTDAKNYGPVSSAEPAVSAPAAAPPLKPPTAGPAAMLENMRGENTPANSGESGRGQAAPPAAPATPPASLPIPKNSWRVTGTVYDLSTLGPVHKAVITFIKDQSPPATTQTDAAGAYQVDLAKGEGWSVRVEAPNYRRGQVLDVDPPYRQRDEDERRAAVEHISDGDLGPAPVGWKTSATKVHLDLVVFPAH